MECGEEMYYILVPACEYRVDSMCRSMHGGCKCEQELGHCVGHGEQTPFNCLKI